VRNSHPLLWLFCTGSNIKGVVIIMKIKPVSIIFLLCLTLCLFACSNGEAQSQEETQEAEQLEPLPPPEPDGGPFGVDVNINMTTIDDFLNRPDVAYVDMRMLYDPARFEAIGGDPNLSRTLPGYRIVPYPFLATLSAMPVENAYEGLTLYDVVWGENEITSISANYAESELILNELFPKDKVIFIMCGGAGYSALTRALLVHLGWDENKIYSTGGNWYYEGNESVDLTVNGNNQKIATWRANYAFIDFDKLTAVS